MIGVNLGSQKGCVRKDLLEISWGVGGEEVLPFIAVVKVDLEG